MRSQANGHFWRAGCAFAMAATLAGCATAPPSKQARSTKEYFSVKQYGAASPRMVAGGSIPRGGGQYLVGNPYTIAGRTYYPAENPNYSAVGMASWYGDAFNGRKTANGEIYDMNAISAAHPTMPLPSYARVTNLANNFSIVVRVNDRGPYHGGRVMDVSSRVADALDFKNAGTGHVKVEYLGRAPMEGSDDRTLLASLRNDGAPANIDGAPAFGQTLVAKAEPAPEPVVALAMAPASPPRQPPVEPALVMASANVTSVPRAMKAAPLPPLRPYDLGTIPDAAVPLAAAAVAILPPPRPHVLADLSDLY